jgi:hypothetical protein
MREGEASNRSLAHTAALADYDSTGRPASCGDSTGKFEGYARSKFFSRGTSNVSSRNHSNVQHIFASFWILFGREAGLAEATLIQMFNYVANRHLVPEASFGSARTAPLSLQPRQTPPGILDSLGLGVVGLIVVG